MVNETLLIASGYMHGDVPGRTKGKEGVSKQEEEEGKGV